jgi:hypothetical protein
MTDRFRSGSGAKPDPNHLRGGTFPWRRRTPDAILPRPTVYDAFMSSDDGMRVVGTIRSIELHTLAAKFQNVTTRQVAKIQLDIERATDETGAELDVVNLADLHFQGPAELVPRFSTGDRVQIVTSVESSLHITSIRPAPLS